MNCFQKESVLNSESCYNFQRIILASGLAPSCDLTHRPLSYNVTLRGEADLRDTLIKLGRAAERKKREREGHYSMSVCVCVCTLLALDSTHYSSCSMTSCDSDGPQTILVRGMVCTPGSPSCGSRNSVPIMAEYPGRST